jgi:hypothetical protein
MRTASRRLFLSYCLFSFFFAGCGRKPAVTISASYIEKGLAGEIATGSTGKMTSNKVGALVSVGGSAKELVSVTIAEIGDDLVDLSIDHPSFDTKRIDIELGESKDVFIGDGSFGVRLQFTESK